VRVRQPAGGLCHRLLQALGELVDLRDVEDREAAEQRHDAARGLAFGVRRRQFVRLVENHGGAVLAAAHLRAELGGLPIGHPGVAAEPRSWASRVSRTQLMPR